MKLTKLCLFLAALFAVVCLLGCPGDAEIEEGPGGGGQGGGGGKKWVKPVYDPSTDETEYYENPTFDTTKVTEVAFFDFDERMPTAYKVKGDGADVEEVEGVGIKGSNCIRVTQQEGYGELMIEVQKAYSKGKSYYFEAWFRDDTDYKVNSGASQASISITVYDQDIVNIAKAAGKEYYDYDSNCSFYDPKQPDPYSIEAVTEIKRPDEDMDYSSALAPILVFNEDGELEEDLVLSEVIEYDAWTRLNGMVYSSDIGHIVDAINPGDLVGFYLNFFLGSYPNQGGYEYYVDNIRFLDLDPQIEGGIGVHVDPPVVDYGDENNLTINISEWIMGDMESFTWSKASSGPVATYELVEGTLPEGLTLAEDGTISGDISATLVEKDGDPKVYTVKIKATNKGGAPEPVTVTITISNAVAPTVEYGDYNTIDINLFGKTSLDVSYTSKGEAAEYEITDGELPAGLTLAKDGTISGTIAATLVEVDGEPKEYEVTIKATNKGGVAEDTVTITIRNESDE